MNSELRTQNSELRTQNSRLVIASATRRSSGFRLRMRAKLAPYPAPIRAAGFTLIELSIVLVVIGLIIGGVLVGLDLVEVAGARSQMSQMEQYQIAANTFRLKYNCKAGDCDNASQFGLGQNGNGDKKLTGNIVPNAIGSIRGFNHSNNTGTRELQSFWVHLSNAKLIDGGFISSSGGSQLHENAKNHFPKDAINKAYLSTTVFNGKTYIMTGVIGITTYNRLCIGSNVLSSAQTRYILNKTVDGYINIGSSAEESFIPSIRVHPTVRGYQCPSAARATYNWQGDACVESDGSGGYRVKEGKSCNIAWQIDY